MTRSAAPEVAAPEIEPEAARGGRPRDEAREQAILDAAIDVLAEVGYEALSIEAVANRAKSSKATIYRRWPGKAELIAEAIRRRSEPAMDPADTGSLRGDLMAMVQTMCDTMQGVDGGLICGVAFAARTDAEFGRLLSSHMHEHKLRSMSLIVSRAQDRGELPSTADPNLLVQVVPGMTLFQQMNGEPLDSGFAAHLVDDILIPILRS